MIVSVQSLYTLRVKIFEPARCVMRELMLNQSFSIRHKIGITHETFLDWPSPQRTA